VNTTRADYLQTAAVTVALLRNPSVAAAWDQPSALAKFSVRGLAGHLARQVTQVPTLLAGTASGEPTRSLFEHYTGSRWVGADLDDAIQVGIRESGEAEAVGGAAALAEQVDHTRDALTTLLFAQPPERTVYLPWGPWELTLDDYLITRILEMAVHCDDVAASVGIDTPPLPERAVSTVVELLGRLAVHRHGAVAVLRTLTRAERAPASIAAI
jgi:hypothetical protein